MQDSAMTFDQQMCSASETFNWCNELSQQNYERSTLKMLQSPFSALQSKESHCSLASSNFPKKHCVTLHYAFNHFLVVYHCFRIVVLFPDNLSGNNNRSFGASIHLQFPGIFFRTSMCRRMPRKQRRVGLWPSWRLSRPWKRPRMWLWAKQCLLL